MDFPERQLRILQNVLRIHASMQPSSVRVKGDTFGQIRLLSRFSEASLLHWTLALRQPLCNVAKIDIHIPDRQGEVVIYSPRACRNDRPLAHLTLAH